MTNEPEKTTAASRFRLRTFGTLRLIGSADDMVLGGYGHQRRRLALLAVLAASEERGRSRAQLMGLFWADIPQARARHCSSSCKRRRFNLAPSEGCIAA